MQLVYFKYLDYYIKGRNYHCPISITAWLHIVKVYSSTDLGFCDRKEVPCTARQQDKYFKAHCRTFLSLFGHTVILLSHYLAIIFSACIASVSSIISNQACHIFGMPSTPRPDLASCHNRSQLGFFKIRQFCECGPVVFTPLNQCNHLLDQGYLCGVVQVEGSISLLHQHL